MPLIAFLDMLNNIEEINIAFKTIKKKYFLLDKDDLNKNEIENGKTINNQPAK